MTLPLDYDRAAPVNIALDVFPAVVSGPGPVLPQRRVRAVLTSPSRRVSEADSLTLYVFADLAPPGLVLRAELPPPDAVAGPLRLPLSLGGYTVAAGGGCACGSRLKNFRFFSSWTRARP